MARTVSEQPSTSLLHPKPSPLPHPLITHGVTSNGHIHFDPNSLSPIQEQHSLFNRHTRTLLLNRPSSLHALTVPMITSLLARISLPASCILLTSTQARRPAFCAGGDVRAVRDHILAGNTSLADLIFRVEFRLNFLLSRLQTPIVALLDGVVMGGGAGLAIHGPFRVATEDALFAMPEAALGIVPDVGASYFLSRMKAPGLGMYIALTGGRLKGPELVAAGIATHFVGKHRIAQLILQLQNERFEGRGDVATALDSFAENKEAIIRGLGVMAQCFTARSVEAIIQRLQEFIAEGKDDVDFAKEALERLMRMCPTSVKISYEAQRRGKGMSLEESLCMEFRLIARCIRRDDFIEGIRTVLVEKGKLAKWEPAQVEDLTQEDVERFFEPFECDLDIPELMLAGDEEHKENESVNARL